MVFCIPKKRAYVLKAFMKMTVVDIICNGRSGKLYIDTEKEIMTLTFGKFEIRYFFGSNCCEVKMKGNDGYYIYNCNNNSYEEFYYDKRAIQTFHRKEDKDFPNDQDLRKKGILPDGYFSHDGDNSTGKLAAFAICDALKNNPIQLMERIKNDIGQKAQDERQKPFAGLFRRGK